MPSGQCSIRAVQYVANSSHDEHNSSPCVLWPWWQYIAIITRTTLHSYSLRCIFIIYGIATKVQKFGINTDVGPIFNSYLCGVNLLPDFTSVNITKKM